MEVKDIRGIRIPCLLPVGPVEPVTAQETSNSAELLAGAPIVLMATPIVCENHLVVGNMQITVSNPPMIKQVIAFISLLLVIFIFIFKVLDLRFIQIV